MIKWFEDNKNLSAPGGAASYKLDNLEITINLNEFNFFNLVDSLGKCITKFKKKYPETNIHLQKWHLDANVQLMKYEPNTHYHFVHCENDGPEGYPKRAFAWMIFLNNIETKIFA